MFLGSVTTMRGQRKLFQLWRKMKRVNVAKAGLERGRIIVKRVLNGPQPSILAASSRLFGMERKNCLKRNTPKGAAKEGRIRA